LGFKTGVFFIKTGCLKERPPWNTTITVPDDAREGEN
jgi:hypothetical protein